MMKVERLPVQHPHKPHCPTCGGDLPAINTFVGTVAADEMGECKLLAVTFHVECPCGAQWDLLKETKKGLQ